MAELFALTMPLAEIGLRATIAYVGLLVLIRIVPKRNAGHLSPNDLLTLIVVGGLATDAVAGGSASLGDILIMIAIILVWAWLFDLLEYRFPAIARLLRDRQSSLIEDGRLIRRNMRRELVTEDELMTALREHGIDDPADVHRARLEADGEISIIKRPSRAGAPRDPA